LSLVKRTFEINQACRVNAPAGHRIIIILAKLSSPLSCHWTILQVRLVRSIVFKHINAPSPHMQIITHAYWLFLLRSLWISPRPLSSCMHACTNHWQACVLMKTAVLPYCILHALNLFTWQTCKLTSLLIIIQPERLICLTSQQSSNKLCINWICHITTKLLYLRRLSILRVITQNTHNHANGSSCGWRHHYIWGLCHRALAWWGE